MSQVCSNWKELGIKGIPVPTDFLLNPDAGYQLLKNRANQAFDLYLSLLKKGSGLYDISHTIDLLK